MVSIKDGFDDDDLNLNDAGSGHKSKRLGAPKVSVFDVLSSKNVPDFSGDAVVHIPKAVFEALASDGTRWDALQRWLIHRDEDLIISNAIDLVSEAIRDGVYIRPDQVIHYGDEERFKTVRGSIDSLAFLYMTVYAQTLETYKSSMEDRIRAELLKDASITHLKTQHEEDQKRISELEADVFEKTKMIGSLKNRVDKLSDSLTSALKSKDDFVKASDELVMGLKKQLDSLMDHFLIRLLKRHYDRH